MRLRYERRGLLRPCSSVDRYLNRLLGSDFLPVGGGDGGALLVGEDGSSLARQAGEQKLLP